MSAIIEVNQHLGRCNESTFQADINGTHVQEVSVMSVTDSVKLYVIKPFNQRGMYSLSGSSCLVVRLRDVVIVIAIVTQIFR